MTDISLPLLHRGKVRDSYEIDDRRMLMVASDRVSAFDVVLKETVPKKGEILTQMSLFWFYYLKGVVPNHLIPDVAVEDVVSLDEAVLLVGRSMVVKRLKPVLVEAVVRGYLTGSGWVDYQKSGAVSGILLPEGLHDGAKLPEPIFTPSTKAPAGEHDEPVSFEWVSNALGHVLASRIREVSLELYRKAAAYALEKGVIIADTKFEFGLDEDGVLTLMDEVLTPDSSRFWLAAEHQAACQAGVPPPSFDKQIIRDCLRAQGWRGQDHNPPALPPEVIEKTSGRYREAYLMLCC